MPNTPNPIDIQSALGGVEYPASRQQIIDSARAGGADEDVIAAIEQVPDREYDGPTAVSQAVADA